MPFLPVLLKWHFMYKKGVWLTRHEKAFIVITYLWTFHFLPCVSPPKSTRLNTIAMKTTNKLWTLVQIARTTPHKNNPHSDLNVLLRKHEILAGLRPRARGSPRLQFVSEYL